MTENNCSMSWTEDFKRLNLTKSVAVTMEEADEKFVLELASQNGSRENIAAVTSDFMVRVFSLCSLDTVAEITGHTDVVTGICWGKNEANLLYSSSKDKTVRCWDVRADTTKEVQKLQGSDETGNMFTCVDINAQDQVVCAGQEADDEENAYILFWDRRCGDLLGAYSESHQDDITQVCFHPHNADSLATGSTDGLVCLFDISQTEEEEAACYTLNSCSTVARIGWCGEEWNNVYCTTHIDTVHVWDSIQGDPVVEITDLKDVLQGPDGIDYVVDCIASKSPDIHILAGNHLGDLRVIEVSSKGTPKALGHLSGGHKSTVRCSVWDNESKCLVTGSENSLLCVWSQQLQASKTGDGQKGKLKAKKSLASRNQPY